MLGGTSLVGQSQGVVDLGLERGAYHLVQKYRFLYASKVLRRWLECVLVPSGLCCSILATEWEEVACPARWDHMEYLKIASIILITWRAYFIHEPGFIVVKVKMDVDRLLGYLMLVPTDSGDPFELMLAPSLTDPAVLIGLDLWITGLL